jgi:radical SAM superfamily enzyme YgiQ (UPF0313 family)
MDLPIREKGDIFLPDGQFSRITADLRRQTHCHDINIVIVYAFDYRTRLLPFFLADRRMPPAGPRAVAAALGNAGFRRVRIVLQQWTPNFRPSQARIDGQPVDVLMISAMQIHSEPAYKLIADAWTLGEQRPLIIAGGAKAIYEPHHFLGIGPDARVHADVAVTGEEYVLLELMQLICSHRTKDEPMRAAFDRVRHEGLLDEVPGLAYRAADCSPHEPLGISTGVQRLLRNLDELPMSHAELRLIEPPHRGTGIGSAENARSWIEKRGRRLILPVVATRGCKFNCEFCPIPAYNQRTLRHKSPERMAEEFREAAESLRLRYFFGTDDNFFARRDTVVSVFEAASRMKINGRRLRTKIRFWTEATEADVYRNRDLLPLCAEGGLSAIWFGIEDLHTGMVSKGQSIEKTLVLFRELRKHNIQPHVMMIHHDDQPLSSPGDLRGVMDQARFVYEAGAVSYQCTYLGALVGSRLLEQAVTSGNHIYKVAGQIVPEAYWDGNHVTATNRNDAWKRQLHLLAAYASFYNPWHLFKTLREHSRDTIGKKRLATQILGMYGIAMTAVKTAKWIYQLWRGPVEKISFWPRHQVTLVDAKTRQEISWAVETKVMKDVEPKPTLLAVKPGNVRTEPEMAGNPVV